MPASRLVPLLLAAAVSCGGGQPDASTLTVFAAASTAETIGPLVEEYGRLHGLRVVTSFAASSTLARQIEQGAPADLFLSADEAWMDHLERRGRIEPGTRVDLLANRLVWITRRDDAQAPPPPACAGRLAMADPDHVPAGRYARAAMASLGWWDELAPRVVPASDVRHALRLVETGACTAGVVYATDADASDDVRVVLVIPESAHPPVRYPAALIRGGGSHARELLAWLRGPEAARRFLGHGFLLPERDAR